KCLGLLTIALPLAVCSTFPNLTVWSMCFHELASCVVESASLGTVVGAIPSHLDVSRLIAGYFRFINRALYPAAIWKPALDFLAARVFLDYFPIVADFESTTDSFARALPVKVLVPFRPFHPPCQPITASHQAWSGRVIRVISNEGAIAI